jgi:hypothetical protein
MNTTYTHIMSTKPAHYFNNVAKVMCCCHVWMCGNNYGV